MQPDTPQLLRRKEVESLCRFGRSTLYKLMREGNFPQPILISARAVRWPENEVRAWIEARPRAAGRVVVTEGDGEAA